MKTIPILNSVSKVSPLDTICDLKWNYPIFNMDRGEFRSCCRTPSNKVTEEELQTYIDMKIIEINYSFIKKNCKGIEYLSQTLIF
jgi:hypothetical protein